MLCVQTNGDNLWFTNRSKAEDMVLVCYRYQGGQPTDRIGVERIKKNTLLTKTDCCRMDVLDDQANQDGKIQYKFMAWPEDPKNLGKALGGWKPEVVTMEYKKGETYYGHKCPRMFLEEEKSEGVWDNPDDRKIIVRSKCEVVIIRGKEVRIERLGAFAAEHAQLYADALLKEKVGDGWKYWLVSKLSKWKAGGEPGDVAFELIFDALTSEFTCTACEKPWHAVRPFISETLCPDCRPENRGLKDRVEPGLKVELMSLADQLCAGA